MKFYIVDGSGYIFRAFYALTSLSNSKGFPTNALFGFLRMFGKLIREERPDFLTVAFDRAEPTFRHNLYEQYKANRKECPADLVPQLPHFRSIVSALGITPLEKPGVEADDIIATLVHRLRADGHEVVVVSGDKDLLQLVQAGVSVFDAMRDVRFSEQAVKEKMGVPPQLVADYLAITGDSSDNVPGVKGIGPKSAVALLEHFGSLDKLLENTQQISAIPGLRGAKSLQEKIESSLEALRLSRTLVALDIQVEPFASAQLSDFAWNGIAEQSLLALCDEFEFRGVFDSFREFKRAPLLQGFAPSSLSGSPVSGVLTSDGQGLLNLGGPAPKDDLDSRRYAGKTFTIIPTDDIDAPVLREFLGSLAEQSVFAFDTETTGLDVFCAQLIGLSFSWKRHEAFYLPVKAENAAALLELLRPIFENEATEKVGYNLKYDFSVLACHGIEVRGRFFDGMVAEHLLHPERRPIGLKQMASQYLAEEMLSYEELLGDSDDIRQVPLERIAKYAAHDADASLAIAEILRKNLASAGSTDQPSPFHLFQIIEMPLLPVLSAMERAGVGLDVEALSQLESELGTGIKELELRIHSLVGHEFNLNSPKQLATILFEQLQLPTKGVRRTQSGFSTDASTLEMLREAHEVVPHLLEYRELHKLLSTYVVAMKRLVNENTRRIHTSFNQAVAATGRLSSTEPNLQNIPIRNERGRKIRKAFSAASDTVIVAADYSQIELRVLAHLSEDENLREAFRSGVDIHERTADELFGRDLVLTPSEKKERRRIAKTINFGVVYGMGAFRLAQDLGVSRREAQNFIDSYFHRYPRVLSYFELVEQQVDRLGYSETLFGRRRYLAEIDTSGRDGGYARRSLLNAPIQGSAAEIIKLSMIRLAKRLSGREKQFRMVLQVHDELVFEVASEVLEEAGQIIRSEMESAVVLAVPLVVDLRSGRNWGDAL